MFAKPLKTFPIVVAMALFPITACSQPAPAPTPDGDTTTTVTQAVSVADAVARLDPLLGTFSVTGGQAGADGSLMAYVPSAAQGRALLNGFGLELDMAVGPAAGQMMTLRVTFSYDQFRQLYRVTVLDDMTGLMDIYEGDFINDNVLSVTNLRSETFYPNGEQPIYFKLEWNISGDAPTFDVLASSDVGKTWASYMQIILTPDA
jgi:hypothetical protein